MQTTQMTAALFAFRDAVREFADEVRENNYGGLTILKLEANGYAHHGDLRITAHVYMDDWIEASTPEAALEEALRRHSFKKQEEQKLLTVASGD